MPQDSAGMKENLGEINKQLLLYELRLEEIGPRIIWLNTLKNVYTKKQEKYLITSKDRIKKYVVKAKFITFLNKIDNMLALQRTQKEIYSMYLVSLRIQKIKKEQGNKEATK